MSYRTLRAAFCAIAVASSALLAGCSTFAHGDPPKNVIFFLGDGMGITTMTAARIYAVGEDGDLTMDTLPESAFIKTYSNNAQVTDSAPSMSAYMTGVKMNNEVISMSPDTVAIDPLADANGNLLKNLCGAQNGRAVTTLVELAKKFHYATGVVTTTRVTHATPAATYAHICHRDLENDIAAQLVPGGAGFNAALGDGLDVILGGGSDHFLPKSAGGKRTDQRDMLVEMKNRGYTFASNAAELRSVQAGQSKRLLGLFSASHMAYDIDRDPAQEPSLAEMTVRAMEVLSKNRNGYFLMVEGGRIDHALHETTARKALQDVWAMDQALKAALDKARETDPQLKNTLVIATADHDHTLLLNGYSKRTGKTTPTNPGVLGLVHRYSNGALSLDRDGAPYTIIGFGLGENRVNGSRASMAKLDDATVSAPNWHQEAVVRTAAGDETHGGGDVFLGAIGMGAERFRGTLDNTEVFGLIKSVLRW